MEDFYKISKQAHNDRLRDEFWKKNNLDNQAKIEYGKFCVWCRVFRNGDFSEKNFKEYQKEENTRFNFWLKKRIAELYFNYKFEFNHETMNWKSQKI